MSTGDNRAGEGPGRPAAGIDIKHLESVLIEMGKSLRAISIYPAGHPQRANLLGQAYGGIQVALQFLGDLTLQVSRQGFLYNDQKIAEGQALPRELAQEMHLRQIKSFSLRKELSLDDFTAFLELLLEGPENFRSGRFIEQWIREKQIKSVWINEMDFSRLSTSDQAFEEGAAEPEAPRPEDHIAEALALLAGEDDPERFGQLLRELEVLARPLIEGKSFEAALEIMDAIAAAAADPERKGAAGEQIRALAQRSARALGRGEFLRWMLERYAEREGRERQELQRTIAPLGPSVIDEIMMLLARTESISAGRPLIDLALSFEGEARSVLERHLKDEDAGKLRKAAYLLGELRDRRSVEAVRKLLDHKDDKVRREAIRALVRIRGMEASRALAAALSNEGNPEVRIIIVSALGESRDLAGAPALMNLLSSVPPREDTMALLTAVIESLGRIGSKEALPHLIKVLNKWPLFNRGKYLPLRIKAAEALGRLGGESAMQALARYSRGKDDPLHRTCAAVLTALLKNDGRPVENIEEHLK
ncbi:MAG TPA: HEAT repeat domain-containing protein [bacterium]|nr:HEAT repeat domain-containing protein [bacterium]